MNSFHKTHTDSSTFELRPRKFQVTVTDWRVTDWVEVKVHFSFTSVPFTPSSSLTVKISIPLTCCTSVIKSREDRRVINTSTGIHALHQPIHSFLCFKLCSSLVVSELLAPNVRTVVSSANPWMEESDRSHLTLRVHSGTTAWDSVTWFSTCLQYLPLNRLGTNTTNVRNCYSVTAVTAELMVTHGFTYTSYLWILWFHPRDLVKLNLQLNPNHSSCSLKHSF